MPPGFGDPQSPVLLLAPLVPGAAGGLGRRGGGQRCHHRGRGGRGVVACTDGHGGDRHERVGVTPTSPGTPRDPWGPPTHPRGRRSSRSRRHLRAAPGPGDTGSVTGTVTRGSPRPPAPAHLGTAGEAQGTVGDTPDSPSRQALAHPAGTPAPALPGDAPPAPLVAPPARRRVAPAGGTVTLLGDPQPPRHPPAPLTVAPCGKCRGSAGPPRAGPGSRGCGTTTARRGSRRNPRTAPTATTRTTRSPLWATPGHRDTRAPGRGHPGTGTPPGTPAGTRRDPRVPPDPPEQPGWGRQCRRCPSRQVQRRQPSGTGEPGGYLRPPAPHGHSRGRTHPAGPAPGSGASSTCPAGHQHPGGGEGAQGVPLTLGSPPQPPRCPPHLGGRAGGAGR